MEDIQEPMSEFDRSQELDSLMSFTAFRAYISELVQMAYIAGKNEINIRQEYNTHLEDTGEVLSLARNYARDKGFPI